MSVDFATVARAKPNRPKTAPSAAADGARPETAAADEVEVLDVEAVDADAADAESPEDEPDESEMDDVLAEVAVTEEELEKIQAELTRKSGGAAPKSSGPPSKQPIASGC